MEYNLENFEQAAKNIFEGRVIREVRYITDQEANEIGLSHKGLVFILDNGTMAWPVSDDEGNDSGAVHTSNSRAQILPVFRVQNF